MRMLRMLGVIAVTVFIAVGASAQQAPPQPAPQAPARLTEPMRARPLQLALVPQIQLVSETESIKGVRLNIYGSNQDVSGVDIGLMHETKGNFGGVSFGLLNFVHGDGRGLQFSGIYSGTEGRMSGLQVGIVNRSGDIHGIQIGLANFADDMTGFQFGLWNEIKSKEQWSVIPIINAAF